MNHPPHKIPQDEYDRRVVKLIDSLLSKGVSTNPETDELFELYNDRMIPTETDKSCSGCRARVFKAMTKYFATIPEDRKQELRAQ